nr:MAG TPA: Regulatory-associated protein of mTOR, Ras-related complex, GTPase, lysosome, SIGNALING [Caudoviricetes sp.]
MKATRRNRWAKAEFGYSRPAFPQGGCFKRF